MSKNAEIAQIFEQMAGMLSILDENPFKIRAYKKAALNILELDENIEDRVEKDDVMFSWEVAMSLPLKCFIMPNYFIFEASTFSIASPVTKNFIH